MNTSSIIYSKKLLYLEKIKNENISYSDLPQEFQNTNFIKDALNVRIDFFKSLPDELKYDVSFLKEIIAESRAYYYVEVLKYVDNDILSNPSIMLDLCQVCDLSYHYLTDDLKQDKNFIKLLLEANSLCFQYLDEKFRNDKELASIVVQCGFGNILKHAGDDVKNDHDIIWAALKDFGSLLKHLPEHYRKNAHIGLAAVSSFPLVFELLDDTLKNNQEFILKCLNVIEPYQAHLFFKALNEEFLYEKEFFKKIINIHPHYFAYASEELKEDKALMLYALKIKDNVFMHAGPTLQKEVGNNNPLQYLESYFLNQKLEKTVTDKTQDGNLIKKNKL